MANIVWTTESQRWLRDIHDYIATDNPDAAHRIVSAIHERAQILLTFPEVGHRYQHNRDIRVLFYGHYRIAYLIKSNGDIDVLGVFHGSLEIERYLA